MVAAAEPLKLAISLFERPESISMQTSLSRGVSSANLAFAVVKRTD
jgi:hypothetical protein